MNNHVRRSASSSAEDRSQGSVENEPERTAGDCDAGSAERLLTLLSDPNARCVMAATAEQALSVQEIVEHCEMSAATAYRKVNQLAEAGLVTETVRIRPDGTNFREFTLRVDSVRVSLTGDGEPVVSLEPSAENAPAAQHPVSTDGGTTDQDHDDDSAPGADSDHSERQERFRQLFTEVTGTEEVTETRDATLQSRYIDGDDDRSVSQYVTALAQDDGLSDTLSDPEN